MWKKAVLTVILYIRTFKLLDLLQEGGREKSEWLGWQASWMILPTFLMQHTVRMDCKEGSDGCDGLKEKLPLQSPDIYEPIIKKTIAMFFGI